MKRLEGKVALVTGSSRGIGAAIARRLATEGAKVVINYTQSGTAALEVVSSIEGEGGQAFAVQADLSLPESAATLVSAALQRYGRLDILVNNAGYGQFEPLEAISPQSYDKQMNLNLRAPLLLAQQAARHLQRGGRIINVSSIMSQGSIPGSSVYAVTKAGVEVLTRVWAAELGPRGITVNCVGPGPVETDLLRTAASEDMLAAMRGSTPLGRLGQPEDIADVVAFLASEESRWVTGQVLFASGGLR